MGDQSDRQNGLRGPVRDPVIDEIARSLQGLRFGSIEIVVHDSRVVHIERRERVRLSDATVPRVAADEWRSKADP